MANYRRRDVLGLIAGFAAQPLCRTPAWAFVSSAPPADGPLSVAAVDALLKQHRVPGAGVAIIENGEIVAAYSYGLAQGQRRVGPHTRFEAASVSKTPNALAVLKLVQAGRIALDDPVNKHLKSWKLPENELTAKTKVTIRMLLSHSAGTSRHGVGHYPRTGPIPSLLDVLEGRRPARPPAVRVIEPPGQAYRYSGGGVMVLQQMLIDLMGEPYEKLLERMVLAPLGMADSSYRQPPDGKIMEQAALGHDTSGAALPGGYHIYPGMAGGGLWTTPTDLCKAAIAIIDSHAGKPGTFLDQRLAQAMLTPVQGRAGLGVFVRQNGEFSHTGAHPGSRSMYVGNVKTGRGCAVMTNGRNGDEVYRALLQQVAQARGWA